jgi:hypothetical protein
MCVDKTAEDPCSCCPKVILIEVDEEEPEVVSVSESLNQVVKDFQSHYLMPRVPVPTRVKPRPVTVEVRF